MALGCGGQQPRQQGILKPGQGNALLGWWAAGAGGAQDEALAPYSVSREVPRSVLKCETVLAALMRPQKFLDTPV